jgi:hypothetical protein
MYSEEVKTLPVPLDPLAASRLKAEIHLRFWLPIAQLLNPRGIGITAPAQDFYSTRFGLDEMKDSLRLMRRYLGVDQLPVGIWFRLRPIFGNLLADALIHSEMDVVACAVREFVRLEAGQDPDTGYGLVEGEPVQDRDRYNPRCRDDDDWLASISDTALSSRDCAHFMIVSRWHKTFDDPLLFEKEFPGMSERRLNMLRALDPIFDRIWFSNFLLAEHGVRYASALLAVDFKELTFRLKRNSVSDHRDAA